MFVCLGCWLLPILFFFFSYKWLTLEIIPQLLHESKYALDYFFYPLSYDLKFKLNIQDLIHVNASQHTWSKCLTSHKLVETLIVRKCFILKIAAMNQICTGYKIYLMKIIGKLINKTKRATFPYHTFLWDALYIFTLILYTACTDGLYFCVHSCTLLYNLTIPTYTYGSLTMLGSVVLLYVYTLVQSLYTYTVQ